MPIEKMFKTRDISEEEFRETDFKTMGIAFEIQNDMGRFWKEKIYQNELAYRCQKAGYAKIEKEVPIIVTYQDFSKKYFIDLLCNDSVVYELKTVDALVGEHKNQTLNYLFLTGLNHGKLINMRSPTVQSEFVSTKISTEKRFDFNVEDSDWKNIDKESEWLKQLVRELLSEWGAYLNIHLFYEAIYHFRGGEENVIKKIKVSNGNRIVGKQKAHLLNDYVAFKISAIIKNQQKYEKQLQKIIQFTNLKAIQWINFKRDHIIFKTITQ